MIGLGVITTGADTGKTNIRGEPEVILVNSGSAFVGPNFYGNVPLDLYIKRLTEVLKDMK